VYASSTCSTSQQQPANFSKLSFETVVLKGLAADGGLFLPEEVPFVTDWVCTLDGQHFARILSFTTLRLTPNAALSQVGKTYRTPS
jgi:threonine synthase